MTDNNLILAIDPGNIQSGYVVVRHNGTEITGVLEKGKVENGRIIQILSRYECVADIAIEMVASYGLPVGKEVFDTCVWVGRFVQAASPTEVELIYRKEEKLYLCGKLTAKDSNITQALVDRFAPGQPNRGKGTVKNPGFFHGFAKDMWAAMSVAVTYFDKYVRGIEL